MTEFEELALKKITKDYLIDSVYLRLSSLLDRYRISNSEISRKIGWDPAGFNQKHSRNSDLRITTFIKIYVALTDIIAERESELGFDKIEPEKIRMDEFISEEELEIGALFNHISAAAEGKTEFLSQPEYRKSYCKMKSFILVGKRSKKFSEREVDVYVAYHKIAAEYGDI